VPLLMVVTPVNVLAAENICVPLPAMLTETVLLPPPVVLAMTPE